MLWGMSKQDYWDTGLARAVDSLPGIPTRYWGDAAYVRQWINMAQEDVLLFTTVADFWLLLTNAKGQERRSLSPPKHPFDIKNGNGFQAERSRVKQWHVDWIQREGVEAQYKAVKGKVDTVSVDWASQLEINHPYLITNTKDVIGALSFVSQGVLDRFTPSVVNLEWMSLGQALRRPWVDRDDRVYWFKVLEAIQQAALDDLEASYGLERSEIKRLVLGDMRS
ncbi:hypothetical protein A7X83_01640 [Stenotrophomonas maltophilia]|uniref:Uncharacterized protein n=2 Tax=Stenotrophomonas maltophilia TaxID=40324 RepID=A0A2W6JY75_STEMA|nr:hypothetical protein A7X83_01640 [Stenotrophomonas maltophilia]